MKSKIKMRMLGAVILIYTMLVVSGLSANKSKPLVNNETTEYIVLAL